MLKYIEDGTNQSVITHSCSDFHISFQFCNYI